MRTRSHPAWQGVSLLIGWAGGSDAGGLLEGTSDKDVGTGRTREHHLDGGSDWVAAGSGG